MAVNTDPINLEAYKDSILYSQVLAQLTGQNAEKELWYEFFTDIDNPKFDWIEDDESLQQNHSLQPQGALVEKPRVIYLDQNRRR